MCEFHQVNVMCTEASIVSKLSTPFDSYMMKVAEDPKLNNQPFHEWGQKMQDSEEANKLDNVIGITCKHPTESFPDCSSYRFPQQFQGFLVARSFKDTSKT